MPLSYEENIRRIKAAKRTLQRLERRGASKTAPRIQWRLSNCGIVQTNVRFHTGALR